MKILAQPGKISKYRLNALFGCIALLLLAPNLPCSGQTLPRAIVLDFTLVSRNIHLTTASTGADAVAVELVQQNLAEVISRKELDKAAKELGIRAPFSVNDYGKLSKELDAKWIVTGRVEFVNLKAEDGHRGVELGLIVKVIDPGTGDNLNGGMARAFSPEAADGSETQGIIEMKAVTAAARRAVFQMKSYSPIEGVILSSPSNGPLVLNRGSGSGVKLHQEFNIMRGGRMVAKARATKISGGYTDLLVTENIAGIQSGDHAISIFPEQKFK